MELESLVLGGFSKQISQSGFCLPARPGSRKLNFDQVHRAVLNYRSLLKDTFTGQEH